MEIFLKSSNFRFKDDNEFIVYEETFYNAPRSEIENICIYLLFDNGVKKRFEIDIQIDENNLPYIKFSHLKTKICSYSNSRIIYEIILKNRKVTKITDYVIEKNILKIKKENKLAPIDKTFKYINITIENKSSNANIRLHDKNGYAITLTKNSVNPILTIYNNIPTIFDYIEQFNDENFIVNYSNEKSKSNEQIEFDRKYNLKIEQFHNHKIYFSERVIGNPKKMIITFPSVFSNLNKTYPITYLSSLEEEISDAIIISFQDYELVYGNYMYKFENGDFVKPILIEFIKTRLQRYRLNEEVLFFYGNSKGATISLDYIDAFPNSYFFACIPQIDLAQYPANQLHKYLLNYYEISKYYNFRDKILEYKNPKVYYYYAELDTICHLGITKEQISGINCYELKNEEHSTAARSLYPHFLSDLKKITSCFHEESKLYEEIQVNVIGTCISRDVFRLVQKEVKTYAARTSFASQMLFNSPNIKISENTKLGNFQRNMVMNDSSKNTKRNIVKFKGILIIDLFDELLEQYVWEDKMFCLSSYVKYEGVEIPNFSKYAPIKIEEKLKLFKKAFDIFMLEAQKNKNIEKIFLIKIRDCKKYSDGSNAKEYIGDRLDKYHEYIEQNYSAVIEIIEPPEINLIGNVDHLWGKYPFHYVDDYYIYCYNEILK